MLSQKDWVLIVLCSSDSDTASFSQIGLSVCSCLLACCQSSLMNRSTNLHHLPVQWWHPCHSDVSVTLQSQTQLIMTWLHLWSLLLAPALTSGCDPHTDHGSCLTTLIAGRVSSVTAPESHQSAPPRLGTTGPLLGQCCHELLELFKYSFIRSIF